jgi:hypothetical protein
LRKASKRTVSFPELVVGSKVSYRGGSFTVEAVQGWMEDKPITAKLKGKEKHVKFDELRPLGSQRSQKLLPRVHDEYSVGDFLFFDKEDQVFAGTVIALCETSRTLTLHDHNYDESYRCWNPLYCVAGEDDPLPYVQQPAASKLSTSLIKPKMIFLKGELTKGFHLTADTRKALSAKLAN